MAKPGAVAPPPRHAPPGVADRQTCRPGSARTAPGIRAWARRPPAATRPACAPERVSVSARVAEAADALVQRHDEVRSQARLHVDDALGRENASRDPSRCDRNVTPVSLMSRSWPSEKTWNPPLSVSIGPSQRISACRPPRRSTVSTPGCSDEVVRVREHARPHPCRARRRASGLLTVPSVPTGMNVGVGTFPWAVCSTPARNPECGSVATTSKRTPVRSRVCSMQLLSDFDYDAASGTASPRCPLSRATRRACSCSTRGTDTLEHRHVRDLPELLRAGRPAGRESIARAASARVRPAEGRWACRAAAAAPTGRRPMAGAVRAPRADCVSGDEVARRPRGHRLRIEDVGPRVARHSRRGLTRTDADAALLAAGSCRCRRTSTAGWAIPSAIRRCLPIRRARRRRRPRGCTSPPSLSIAWPRRGVEFATIVLHVGLDTFRPVLEADPTRTPHAPRVVPVPRVPGAAIRGRARRGRASWPSAPPWYVRSRPGPTSGQAEGWTDLFILPGLPLPA